MIRRPLLVLLVLGFARLAGAQTHPCDQTVPTNPTVQSPARASFCHQGLDTSGQPVTITAFKVYLDGSTTPVFSGPLTPIGLPSASGFSFYETPTFPVTRGSHTAMVSALSADGEGAKTLAFPFVVIAVPGAPVKLQIKQ
jgi:hypothetical protein